MQKHMKKSKILKNSLQTIIKSLNLKDVNEEQLIEIKNKQNCLISFYNFKNDNKNESKITYSGSNNGFFRF